MYDDELPHLSRANNAELKKSVDFMEKYKISKNPKKEGKRSKTTKEIHKLLS
jgi:hypothetical protein